MRSILLTLLFSPIFVLHANPITVENSKAGTPNWFLRNPSLLHEIEGYASKTSVNLGDSIDIFVNTSSPNYSWELFRLGWYNSVGARKIIDSTTMAQSFQPTCTQESGTNLVNCPWSKSFSIQTSIRWTTGVYVVRLTELATNKDFFVSFVIRDDTRPAEMAFTRSVNTDVAYSRWGGHDLYNDAVKVSFNSPILAPPFSPYPQAVGTGKFFAYYEYNLVRWLEKRGYDVKYITNVDVHEDYQRFSNAQIFISAGHDEYWSGQMRTNLNLFRQDGKSIFFLSSNTMYWQVRFESDAAGNPNRIMTCYKNATNDPVTDPAQKTVRFRDPPLNFPEDEMIGVLYDGDDPANNDMMVRDASHWVFNGTGLQDGGIIPRVLGYEVDQMRWSAPKSTERLATSTFIGAHGTLTNSDMTIYRTDKGGYVFSPGTMQWIWGLDDYNVNINAFRGIASAVVDAITRNIIFRILYSRCATSLYPIDPILINLNFQDPVGSTHFKDSSSYGRSALCFPPNCPTIVKDNGISALQFTSHSQYVDLGIEPSLRGKTGFSIAFSIKMNPGTDSFIILQQRDGRTTKQAAGYDGSFQISVDAAGSIGFWTYSTQNEHALWMKSARLIRDGNWHNVVLSRLTSGAGVISIDNVEDTYRIFDRIDVLKPHTIYLAHDAFQPVGLIGQISNLKIWNH